MAYKIYVNFLTCKVGGKNKSYLSKTFSRARTSYNTALSYDTLNISIASAVGSVIIYATRSCSRNSRRKLTGVNIIVCLPSHV